MRYLLALLLTGVFACSGQVEAQHDGSVETMERLEQALEASPPAADSNSVYTYKDEKTLECYGGGTVFIKVNWSLVETSYARKYYVSWDYTDCVTLLHGTINGKSHYSKNNEDKATHWFTGVNYYADLVHTGSMERECDAYMIMTKKTEGQIRDLVVREHCPHPVSHWWGMWW